MFKAIHGLAPQYLCNDVTMIVDVHGYNTISSENINLYVLKYTKEICKCNFAYKRNMLWNDLPDEVKESSSLDAFKSNNRSTLDKDSLHTMAFVFVVLHMPCFKLIQVISLKFLYIYLFMFAHLMILKLVFYSPVRIRYDVGIHLFFYIIAMILSNYCICHVDLETIVLYAYCNYIIF